MSKRYCRSEDLLKKALKVIPLGSQTFSKSKTQYPYGVSPYFIKKGKGSRVWDVDDNEYVDFVNALASITLGHNDPDVSEAIKKYIEIGTIHSLPHEIEIEVAEKIVEMVPCAEMVRFGKNASDATAGAIRLARAYTKRDHVAVCGYHGWQDWYIGSTPRNMGVPKTVQDLTHTFSYNELDSLRKIFSDNPDQIAAVIMEPMNVVEPENGFLENVKDMANNKGALFILDETVTGFRYSKGGAQEYFGITPDLATFGKGMANGYPISAIVGPEKIMQLMEEIFFSFTYAGEILSLGASLTALTKIQNEPVIETLWSQGKKIVEGTKEIIINNDLTDVVSVKGKDCWSFLIFNGKGKYTEWDIKTLFMQEVFARGVLAIGSHNMSYAHSDNDVSLLIKVYSEVFSVLAESLKNEDVHKRLNTVPLKPLFKIR